MNGFSGGRARAGVRLDGRESTLDSQRRSIAGCVGPRAQSLRGDEATALCLHDRGDDLVEIERTGGDVDQRAKGRRHPEAGVFLLLGGRHDRAVQEDARRLGAKPGGTLR